MIAHSMTPLPRNPEIVIETECTHVRMSKTTRQTLFNVALIAGLFIVGGLCGLGVRTWIGGLRVQYAQLERCILASKHSHPGEDARSTLEHLHVEVPACMNGAGYEKALDNQSCAPAFWQGDVFCYLPKSYLGKLIYRIETKQQMQQTARLRLEARER
jgi:hypothetical protein